MFNGDKFKAGYPRLCSKSRVSIMVWLVVAADGRSKLILCDERQDSDLYISIVLTPALNFVRQLALRGSIPFQQDNASSHVSRRTLDWMAQHRVNLLEPWLAMSPDLNLVEHCWAKIAQGLIGKSFLTTDDLWAGVQRAWSEIPASFVGSLCASMARRLTAVVVARGGNTKY